MDINQLITIVKKKITSQVIIEEIIIEDKSYLHKNHKGNEKGKFHLKIFIKSNNLKSLSKIDSNKKIYKILNEEMKTHIHSLQILVS
jgi:BolA protein